MIGTFLLSGCATSSGPVFKEVLPDKESVVYLYREFAVAGAVFSAYVSVDGKEIIGLSNEAYFPYKTKPGLIRIKATGGIMERNLSLKVESGKDYYVRTGGVMSENDFILLLMRPDIGKAQIKDNRLQVAE